MVKLIRYNETYHRLVSFNNDILKKNDYKTIRKKNKSFYDDVEFNFTDKKEIERISLSRTKSNIKAICLSNNFDYFMTVTVNSKNADRFSLSEVQEKMKKICKKIKRKYKDFAYIFITEKHKNGAFHFHGFIKGIPESDLILFDVNDNIPLKIKNSILAGEIIYHYKIFDEEMGFNTFSTIRNYNACCSYILKYITKDCIKNENNQIYFCSRGLSRGESEYFVDKNLRDIFGDDIYSNEFCQIKDFDFSKLSLKQQQDLIEYFDMSYEMLQDDNTYITNWLKLFTKVKNICIK